MSVQILRGNALSLPLADDSVDLVVTSPPYFGLRSYQDGGSHYSGQIGDEATPAEFVDALIAATAEMVRVVKPSGSIWVNLGDKYASTSTPGPQSQNSTMTGGRHKGVDHVLPRRLTPGAPPKSLIGIPWRYALRCIDDLGLILRAEVIWSKPNGLPESVTDRVRRSHETWFHFTLRPRYYSAVDEIREGMGRQPTKGERLNGTSTAIGAADAEGGAFNRRHDWVPAANPLGKLPGSVWTINEGDSLVRSVLNAVASQGISPDEGERILLWSRLSDSCNTSESLTRDAGNGSSTAMHADTPRSQSEDGAKNSSTASPTSCTSGQSLTDSPSTTSAGTRPASGPTTSSPSLSERTSDAPTLSGSSADTGTPWTTPTPTSPRQGSTTRGAAHASSPASDVGESVWQVPTQPLRVPAELGIDHFAAFPLEFPRRIIRGWSPAGVCVDCGEGRRPVVASVGLDMSRPQARRAHELAEAGGLTEAHFKALLSVGVSDTGRGKATQSGTGKNSPEVYVLADKAREVLGGYAREYLLRRPTGFTYACACPEPTAPTRPATVLDPFGGTGTTALVADALGRHGISVDMSADYCRLAGWRTTDPGERARARQVDKPATQIDGQADLFQLLDQEVS